MKKIIIRNIEEKDIPDVVDIQIRGWQTAYKNIIDEKFLQSMDREKKIEKQKQEYKNTSFIVAELAGQVVGYCRYLENNDYQQNIDCEIRALYVKPELKYQGIGSQLVTFVINEFKQKNKTKMIIWCLKENEPSKKFYTKMGGKIMAEKSIEIGEKTYPEVGFVYDLK